MDSVGLGIDEFEESTHIGTEEFARMSMREDIATDLMFFSEYGERFFIDTPACLCFLEWLYSHGLKEKLLELERGGKID